MILISLLICVLIALIIKLYCYFTFGRYVIKKSLTGKHILITGGTSGIGKETVHQLSLHGATVHILARNLKKAEEVVEELKQKTGSDLDIRVHELNLSSFQSVRQFCTKYLAGDLPINVLINNAALMNNTRRLTEDGYEETFQVNHLSHFLLTNLLLDRIILSGPESRIINVSSGAHTNVKHFDLTDLNFEHQPYTMCGFDAYSYSKLENILFTKELARRLYAKGVTANCLHPGIVRTDLLRDYAWYHPLMLLMYIIKMFMKTSSEGAQTTNFLAVSDEVANISGHYFADCKLTTTTLLAIDDRLALDLWNESLRLTGLNNQ